PTKPTKVSSSTPNHTPHIHAFYKVPARTDYHHPSARECCARLFEQRLAPQRRSIHWQCRADGIPPVRTTRSTRRGERRTKHLVPRAQAQTQRLHHQRLRG